MSITPPVSSAFDLYFVPKTLPTFAPAMDMMQVVQPIMLTAPTMFTSRNAKVMPAARASMLVATASISMVLKDSEPLSLPASSSLESASRIIFAPMSESSMNATQ